MIASIIKKHENYRLSSLNLIASENRISADALNALASDLAGRYGDKWYGGSLHANEIFLEVERLAKKLFHAKYAFITPISGNICDLAVLFSFTKCGDKVAGIPKEEGGYPFGYEKFEREFISLPARNYEIKVKEALDVIEKEKPLLTLLGASVFPFPHPVKELKKAREYGTLAYDASHVLGLIAGGKFQQPLQEGADVMTGSTHKTLPGPQGGAILAAKTREEDDSMKYLDWGVFPGVTSSYHLHHVAAKAIAFAEHLTFGKEYAEQIVKNAKKLAEALYNNGFDVLGKDYGFTESHQVLFKVGKEKGKWAAEELEKAGIIANMNMVPGDEHPMRPSGIRLGVQELTRLGMREGEMEEVALFFKRLLIDGEEAGRVRKDVVEFKKNYRKICYCFHEGEDPYEFIELIKI